MKPLAWNANKNRWLIDERSVSFEDVVFHMGTGDLLDDYEHPNQERYPGQRVFAVRIRGYVCLVPYVDSEEHYFLKTIMPSRKATRKYLRSTHGRSET